MIGLFFGGLKFQASFGNTYGNIELDAMLEEHHEWSAEVTSNPVEEGSPVTDHVIEQSDKITAKCFVSDAPLYISNSFPGVSRSENAFNLLHKLLKMKLEVTVYTKHRVYTDMIISNISIPRTGADGESLEFNIEFIQIRKVSTQLVAVPAGISPKKENIEGGSAENTHKDKVTGEAKPNTSRKAEAQKVTGKVQNSTVNAKIVEKVQGPTSPSTLWSLIRG